MSKQLRTLQTRKSGLVKEARALTDLATNEARDMTDAEVAAFDVLRGKIDAVSSAIDREAALIAEEARLSASDALGIVVTDTRPRHSGLVVEVPLIGYCFTSNGGLYAHI
jgi:hypothetical protein